MSYTWIQKFIILGDEEQTPAAAYPHRHKILLGIRGIPKRRKRQQQQQPSRGGRDLVIVEPVNLLSFLPLPPRRPSYTHARTHSSRSLLFAISAATAAAEAAAASEATTIRGDRSEEKKESHPYIYER